MLDAKNVALALAARRTTTGKGTIDRVRVTAPTEWGDDIPAIGTFLRDSEADLYNLYVVDPSEEQILRYSPAARRQRLPGQADRWLATARDVERHHLDVHRRRHLGRRRRRARALRVGQERGWEAEPARATSPAPRHAARTVRHRRRATEATGMIYGFDQANQRIVAFDKANGDVRRAVPARRRRHGWTDMRGLYVDAGVEDEPDDAGLDRQAASTRPCSRPSRTPRPPAPSAADARRPAAPADAASSRRPSPGRGAPVIPLRDANPTRRTPVVTLALIVACFVAFAIELRSPGERRRRGPRAASSDVGRRPRRPHRRRSIAAITWLDASR